jgi:hypothetical protein
MERTRDHPIPSIDADILICLSLVVFFSPSQTDKKAFEELVAANGWTLAEDGKVVVIRPAPSAASGKDVKESQRQEYPTMEQLAKLIVTGV